MAAGVTYTPIMTTTLSSASGAVGFSSIPSTYTDLVCIASIKMNSGTPNINFYMNAIDSQSYSSTIIKGDGTSATSSRNANKYGSGGGAPIGEVTTEWGTVTLQLNNYSNTTTYKTILSRDTDSNGSTEAFVGLWRGSTGSATQAITSITFYTAGNFTGGSVTLYGIANADTGALATGGVITYDSTYYYHTFGSSGTFTPKQSLTADILVVAGGGGGSGGGGGAGGLLG